MVALLYRRVTGDSELAGYFVGVDLERLEAHMRWFLAAALGGPDTFTGRGLREAHAGRGITDRAFDRVAEHLMTALGDLGVHATDVGIVAETVGSLRTLVVAPSSVADATLGPTGAGDRS